MSINTPIGDTLDGFLEALLGGRSAITRWKTIDAEGIYSKVGGDLSTYDVGYKVNELCAGVPDDMLRRLRKLVPRSPWSTQLTMLLAVQAWLDAGFGDQRPL